MGHRLNNLETQLKTPWKPDKSEFFIRWFHMTLNTLMNENPKLNSEHMLSGEIKLLLMKPFLFLKSHQPNTSFHQKSSQTKRKLRQIPKNMTHRIDLTKAVTDRDKTMIRVISPGVRLYPTRSRDGRGPDSWPGFVSPDGQDSWPWTHGLDSWLQTWVVWRELFDPWKTVSEFVQMLLTILLGCFICAGLLKVSIMVSG